MREVSLVVKASQDLAYYRTTIQILADSHHPRVAVSDLEAILSLRKPLSVIAKSFHYGNCFSGIGRPLI